MQKRLLALTALGALCGLSPAAANIPHLKEDYQVIQRDAHDQGVCVVHLPEGMARAAGFLIKVVDKEGKSVRASEAMPKARDGKARALLLEGLPLGGPYTITISAKDQAAARPLVYKHILVGDIWLLGGQSNMFGA